MTISGVALLAICTLLGSLLGDWLGIALGVKANVGGVGIAMMLLIAARLWLFRHGRLSQGVMLGVGFWSALYIPIVIAMAAQQDVVSALKSGPVVVVAALGTLLVCFAAVALISRMSDPVATMDEIEAQQTDASGKPGQQA